MSLGSMGRRVSRVELGMVKHSWRLRRSRVWSLASWGCEAKVERVETEEIASEKAWTKLFDDAAQKSRACSWGRPKNRVRRSLEDSSFSTCSWSRTSFIFRVCARTFSKVSEVKFLTAEILLLERPEQSGLR